ncbi:MAG: hypothetical protein J6C15_04755 [Bacteroidaceae bacterium]|nr:hypothetical protein [Bacteroidaceae bacterium]MBO5134446.1 hypothetical protein [Bacteroidaceae bacterium]
MCENNANESVKKALIEYGFKESPNGNALEKELNENDSLKLWKYIGLNETLLRGKKMRILMLKNGTIIANPSDVDEFNNEIFN